MAPQTARRSPDEMLRSLTGATTWLNSPPLAPEDLRGKVVLVDFWTYTCINWRRTVPHLRSWVDRYGHAGLVLVGVHAPEFAFERDPGNVRRATREIGLEYPIAVDNDFSIWRAFSNRYWPALYVFDAQGRLRHHQFGEEGYERAEAVIRRLLEEAGARELPPPAARVAARGPEAAADWENLRSAENYLGWRRTQSFASPGGIVAGEPHRYALPTALALNSWALLGTWTCEADRAVVGAAGGRIVYRFHARDLHLVMGPQTRGRAIRFRVLLGGKPPGEARGTDVDRDGHGTLLEQRMYHLVRQPGAIEDRLFEIQFLEPGAAAFCFTFG